MFGILSRGSLMQQEKEESILSRGGEWVALLRTRNTLRTKNMRKRKLFIHLCNKYPAPLAAPRLLLIDDKRCCSYSTDCTLHTILPPAPRHLTGDICGVITAF
jgi:hypothetical protein